MGSRDYSNLSRCRSCLRNFKEAFGTMNILTTFEEVVSFFKGRTLPQFSFDTETDRLNYYDQQIEILTMFDGKDEILIDFRNNKDTGAILSILKPIFEEAKVIVAQNSVFDLGVIDRYGIYPEKVELFDTMIAQHLLDENGRCGLKQMAKDYLGVEETLTYDEAKNSGKSTFYRYAMNDAVWTWEIAKIQKELIKEQGLVHLFRDIEMPFMRVLLDMKRNGVLIDTNKVARVTSELKVLITDLEIQMLETLGEKISFQHSLLDTKPVAVHNFNFNSTLQLSKILFDRLGLEVIERTPSGARGVGKITIKTYKDRVPFVQLLYKYKAAQKLLNSFFEPLPKFLDEDGRVRTEFKDHGTVTGRLSARKPNLQQLPNDNKLFDFGTRECFIASPGKKMVAIDYSQQELRIMAQLSKDPKLVKIINDGGDLHLINANTVFDLGIPEEKCYKNHPEYETIKKQYKQDRNKGKVFSFGIPYGMGAHKLSRDFNVSMEEAEKLLEKFFEGFPDLKKAIDQAHKDTKENLQVVSFSGRRRRFQKDVHGNVDFRAFRQSFNFLIQSFGADLIRMACNKIRLYSDNNPHLGISLLMTVHDEVVLECNSEYAEEVAQECELLFERCTPDDFVVQLKADSDVGDNYGEAK